MEKTRVNKGEAYYWIASSSVYGFVVVCSEETNIVSDNDRWESGNYFDKKSDADAVVKKLSAVLKGACVIEVPSEEDATNVEWDKYCESDVSSSFEPYDAFHGGFQDCYKWFKSKIVK